MLISGQWQTESEVFTLEYDLETGEQHLLECDGLPACKCTILGNEVLYALRIAEHFEERRINESSTLSRRPINTVVRRQPGQVQAIVTQPTGDCGCRGRSGQAGMPNTPEDSPLPTEVSGHGGSGPDSFPVTRATRLECAKRHLNAAYP